MDYTILPVQAFPVYRSCPGCGVKRRFVSTGKFRINANGSRLDVWLIYQCECCRHTWNLTVYERVQKLAEKEYRQFAENDPSLALQWGCRKEVFLKNHVQPAVEEVAYEIRKNRENPEDGQVWLLRDPYRLHIRTERILAELLEISRSRIHKMKMEGEITWKETEEGTKDVFQNRSACDPQDFMIE